MCVSWGPIEITFYRIERRSTLSWSGVVFPYTQPSAVCYKLIFPLTLENF